MQEIPKNLENLQKTTKNYDYLSLIQFESPNKDSSFGKMPLSSIKSSPIYGFGSCDRDNTKKLYLSKDLSKQSLGNSFLTIKPLKFKRNALPWCFLRNF